LLPGIASKLGLPIIANAVESSKTKKVFSNDDAKELLKEVAILREKLPNEGKAIVHRYGGVLDRLEKMANIAIKYRTRFYFV
jgi:DNA-directed RNA polymerase beta' subunit